MKKYFFLIPLILALAGCASMPHIFGHASNQVAKQNNKIVAVQKSLDNNKDQKINEAQQFSYATEYAINKITNKEPALTIAKDMNWRVEQIMGLPDFEQQIAMQSLVNGLISNNIVAQEQLTQKDKDITALQNEENTLIKAKDVEINKSITLSQTIASQSDTQQVQLNKYSSYWGLGAVAIGLMSFVHHLLWVGGISIIIFIILRTLAATNPLANAVFGIFQSIGASIIHIIETLIPQSISTLNAAKVEVSNVSNSIASIVAPTNPTPPTNTTKT